MSNILIYGGALNPIHYAHLNNIKLASQALDFKEIILVPNCLAHFKNNEELADINDRLKMIELAIEEYDFKVPFSICEYEINAKEKVYTYDLIKYLKTIYPDDQLFFLIGSDQALNLEKWYKIADLKEMVTFVVTKRDNDFDDSELFVIDNQPLDYSSTRIREDYESSGLVLVDKYIRENGLYLNCFVAKRLSSKRYAHVKNVAKMACAYASKYKIDPKKAYIAAMLHDIAKELPLEKQYELIDDKEDKFELVDATAHSYAARNLIVNELKIDDEQILDAIEKHTTGSEKMSDLAKLIYCVDMLSYERDYPEKKKLVKILDKDLDQAFKECFIASYHFLEEKGLEISDELKNLKRKVERNEV